MDWIAVCTCIVLIITVVLDIIKSAKDTKGLFGEHRYRKEEHKRIDDTMKEKFNVVQQDNREIRQNINVATKEITSISCKMDTDRETKRLQYDSLKDNEKTILDSIEKISALGEALKETTYKNKELMIEISQLKQRIRQLQEQHIKYQQNEPTQDNDFTQSM